MADESPGGLRVVVVLDGLKVHNPLNSSHGHWAERKRREDGERVLARVRLGELGAAVRDALRGAPAVAVTLTRVGGRHMDEDGCVAGLKAVRDAVADWLRPGLPPGKADGPGHGLTFGYAQEKGAGYSVRVEMRTGGGAT